LRVDSSGNSSLQELNSYSATSTGFDNFPVPDFSHHEFVPNINLSEPIPDGQGAALVGWSYHSPGGPYDCVNSVCTVPTPSVTEARVSNTNGGMYTLPFSDWNSAEIEIGKMVLGDNNVAFATNGQELVAFDANSGATQWTWQPQQNQPFSLIAAADGGGVFVNEFNTSTTTEDIVQLDSGGVVSNTLSFGTINTDMDPLGNFYGAGAGQLLAQNSPVAGSSKSPHSHRRGNPAHNGHTYSANAVPTNYRLLPKLTEIYDDIAMMTTYYTWDSSSGPRERLSKCEVREYVTYNAPLGSCDKPIYYQPPSPPWPVGKGGTFPNPTCPQPAPATYKVGKDNNILGNNIFVKPYKFDQFTATQVAQYSCDHRQTWINFGGPFDIVRSVIQDPSDGSWHYILTKTGVNGNVDYPLP